jgi:hypothetical protein
MTYFNKTSTLVPYQLPEFIRDDPNYVTFVAFIKAYYEWTELQGGSTYGSKNLLSYSDIDTTLDEFLKFYKNDFLPFFPEDSLVDQRKLTKIAKELYKSKGTPASYEFLFRVLYNSESQLFNASDYILRASDGKWIITKLLNILSSDPIWFSTINYRLFGETSKGYATIEDIIPVDGTTQIVLSGIDRNFTTGEFVRVIDIHGNDVLINGNVVRAQVFGKVSSVNVDPNSTGEGYNVGDPVVFYGGLNPNVLNPVGASGYISSVTSASVTSITPVRKGEGYRAGAFTSVSVNSGSGSGTGAVAILDKLDTANPYYVYNIGTDTISPRASILLSSANYNFPNLVNANANTRLVDALSFPVLTTYGISSIKVTSGGTGYDSTTSANATGYYTTDTGNVSSFASLGILGLPIIDKGGLNYQVNDTIVFTGGSGHDAYANVTQVYANGAIKQVLYNFGPTPAFRYPLGGVGYQSQLPTLSVNTATGSGASLFVPGLLGADATFTIGSTVYGQVQEITLTNSGLDYINTPNVSLRVEDLLVYNVDITNKPKTGDTIYQGTPNNTTFIANVAYLTINTSNTSNTFSSTYDLRVYDYSGDFNANNNILVLRNGSDLGVSLKLSQQTTGVYTLGRKIYGNGGAKAIVSFTNGIQYGSGFYQNSDGQPSAYSLLEDENYNNYAYILHVEAALEKYKNTALSFLHPSGMKYNTFNLLKNDVSFHSSMSSEELAIKQFLYLIQTPYYVANTTGNVITFTNLNGANVANVVLPNSYITIYPTNSSEPFYSSINTVTANTITINDYWNTVVPNVAIASANANSTIININSITNSWKIATGNNVTYISDLLHVYDYVSFDGITYKQVVHVDQPNTGTTIIVDSTYPTAQSGYLYLKQNVISSNVWVSGIVELIDTVELTTESGSLLTTESGSIIILG